MHIFCLGVNHTSAPLNLREQLAFSEEKARSTLAQFYGDEVSEHAHELVIVSTCNRVELYFTGEEPSLDELEAFLSKAQAVPVEVFHRLLYRLIDGEVVDHLCRVTTGLDSLVIGEPQILGQVTGWLELAMEAGTCGPVLSTLFRSAIHAGKRARAETAIARNPASISSLAAAIASREVKDLPNAQVVVVGAGEMAELAVEALRKRGVSQIVVVNRTLKKGQLLAERWRARSDTIKHLDAWLLKADIIISSTGAQQAIISSARMEKIMPKRLWRPIVMIDIAVPRDIDPGIGHIQGVKLFDMDALKQQVDTFLAERAAEIPKVEAILEEEKRQLVDYLKTLDMLPLISGLRQHAEAIRHQELERTFHRLPELTDLERERIEAMSRALVKKLLATPTHRLRVEASGPHALEYANMARTLFDLHGDSEVFASTDPKCSESPALPHGPERLQ